MKKNILILGAGLYNINVIKEIKKIGYKVIAIDRDLNAPGFVYADDYSVIDIVNREAVLKYALEMKIDGIMPINDFGVRTACFVSRKLNLVGNTLSTGICANDKGIMRDLWNSENLSQPKYIIINKDIEDLKIIKDKIKYPLVAKPTDCGGAGRGVSIAKNDKELIDSIELAKPFAKNDRIIIEEFIEGTELTIDALSYKGNASILSISDKEKPVQKYRVATSLNFPAKISHKQRVEVEELVKNAITTIGISNGASHTEVIIDKEGKPYLVEISARGGGGHLFNTIVYENTGLNYPQEFAKILCEEKPNLKIIKNEGVVYRFFNPPIGKIKEIIISNKIDLLPYIVTYGITAKKGDVFNGLIDSMHRVGFLVAKGNTREEAIKNADEAESLIRFIVE